MHIGSFKRDRIMTAIFGQLEMLQELASKADDRELANDISAALADALTRYCDRKRGYLASQLADGLKTVDGQTS